MRSTPVRLPHLSQTFIGNVNRGHKYREPVYRVIKCPPDFQPAGVFVFISNAYAQAAAAPAVTGPFGLSGSVGTFLPFIVMAAVLYFLMIRPQMKRQKEQRTLMAALAKGDEVLTSGGFLGKVVRVADAYLVLEIGTGVEIVVQKSAIVTLLPKGTIKAI
jgi:preprotein translocase subunit YajC